MQLRGVTWAGPGWQAGLGLTLRRRKRDLRLINKTSGEGGPKAIKKRLTNVKFATGHLDVLISYAREDIDFDRYLDSR